MNPFGGIRRKVANWLLSSVTTEDLVKSGLLLDSAESAGQSVNEKSVMSLAAAWACTRLISQSIASLPFVVYERRPNGTRVRARHHPLYEQLHDAPNSDTTASVYWEAVVASILLRGNSFSERKMVGQRQIGMDFLVPTRLRPKDRSMSEFWYTEYDGTRRTIPRQRIWHVPGFTLDGKLGLSAISYGAGVFGNALAAQAAANSTFEKGLTSKVLFTLDKVVNKQKLEEFENYMRSLRGAINQGEIPLLEKGMDAKVLSISPRDAQLLESRLYGVEEVCRFFLVDPSMIGHGGKDSNWGTGLEQKLIRFLTFTLMPITRRVEQGVNHKLFSDRDRGKYYGEFSLEGFLRADSQARANFYSVLVTHGIFTRDEVRVLENRDPMGGNAGKLTVQSSMTTLDSIGGVSQSDRVIAALKHAISDNQE